MLRTHEVVNQATPLVVYDVFGADAALVEALDRDGASWASAELHELGRRAGSFEAQELGRQAEATRRAADPRPVRQPHRRGQYHPAYHELMTTAIGHGLHAAPWADGRTGAHVARAAKVITWYQVDGGHVCPISMTYSVVPALRHEHGLQPSGNRASDRAPTTRPTAPHAARPARPVAWP